MIPLFFGSWRSAKAKPENFNPPPVKNVVTLAAPPVSPSRRSSTFENQKIAEKILEEAQSGNCPPPSPRVNSITISRLYNLGNYEHVKYEVGIEIPREADAGAALLQLVKAIRGLRPIRVNREKLGSCMQLIEDPEKQREFYGDRLDREVERAKEYIAAFNAEQQRVKDALQLFNELGGTTTFTDAKEYWTEYE